MLRYDGLGVPVFQSDRPDILAGVASEECSQGRGRFSGPDARIKDLSESMNKKRTNSV